MIPRFSFIVPIFNAEKYLPICLASIQGQTFSDFEAILIDDGSTDLSGAIADDFSIHDSRFRVVHQRNAGTSGATNTALSMAMGEYIINLDDDDYVSPNLLERSLDLIERFHPDILQYLAVFIDEEGVETGRQEFYKEGRLFDGHESLKSCEACMPGGFSRTHSRKVIRRELTKHLLFVGTSKGADTSFLRRLLFQCERVYLSPEAFFFVREISTSESRKPNPRFLYKEWFNRMVDDLDYCVSENERLHRSSPFFEFADCLDMFQMFAAKAINENAYDRVYFRGLAKRLNRRKKYLVGHGLREKIRFSVWIMQTKACASRLAKKIHKGDFIV